MKLAETRYAVARQPGLHVLQERGAGLAAELSSWRLCLEAGESQRWESADEETALVLQSGSGTVSGDGFEHAIARSGVFEQRATALLIPPGVEVAVRAETPLEAILIAAAVEPGADGDLTALRPALVGPDDVQVHQRGRDGFCREVHDLFVDDAHGRRLLVGETFNAPGMWSSYPPHKHDGLDGEPRLEEVYYYRVDPPQGFGHQMLYTAAGERVCHVVRDGDLVVIPYGYHPVSAPPGYRLYYLWALAGEQRRLALYEDPEHRWIHRAPADDASAPADG